MLSGDSLDVIRKEIDKIDAELTRLLENRMDLVKGVLEYKRQTGMAILDTTREQKILERILSGVGNKEYKEAIKAVYTAIFEASRGFQRLRLSSESRSDSLKFGLIGKKLSHSLSPRIHTLLFNERQINAEYDLIEAPPEDLPDLLDNIKSKGYLGVNVTIPYKKEIMSYLDSLSDEAIHIGAVNTISLVDGFKGYNTDYDGFGMALEEAGILPEGARCAVIGSGGAARAVVAFLEDHGAVEITIVTRDTDGAMLKFPGLTSLDISSFQARGYDLVINTTPVGMYPDIFESPINKKQLEGAGFVMDLIYNPAKTLLMKYSEELGIRHANGLFMLAAQAFRSEEIWLGKSLDRSFIQKTVDEIRGSL